LLLLAGLIALRRRSTATMIASVVFLASIIVGVLGAYYHLRRAVLPTGPLGQQVSLGLLVWAPPILGPTMFAMVGVLGISAAWVETPPDSGTLKLGSRRRLSLPYSKTRAYLFIVGMGALATVISSVLDHARSGFVNPWLWLPTGVGIFATIAAVVVAALDRPGRIDLTVYAASMILMILVGVVGAVLHVNLNLISGSQVVLERFIRGAPILAPMLYANIGTLGAIAILDPADGLTQSVVSWGRGERCESLPKLPRAICRALGVALFMP
jgi:hypothetical protein